MASPSTHAGTPIEAGGRVSELEHAPPSSQGLLESIVRDHRDAGSFHDILRSLDTSSGFSNAKSLDRSAFSADCSKLRHRMRVTRRGFVNPRSSWMGVWDMTTAVALLYTATVTPFEVGLDLPTRIDALFFINQVINVIFMVDICLQFFLPIPDHQGELIRDRKLIAMRYLKSWFVLDVVSVLPLDIYVVTLDEESAATKAWERLTGALLRRAASHWVREALATLIPDYEDHLRAAELGSSV